MANPIHESLTEALPALNETDALRQQVADLQRELSKANCRDVGQGLRWASGAGTALWPNDKPSPLTEEILANLIDALVLVDREWRVTYINPEAGRSREMKAEELVGKSFWESWPDPADPKIEQQLRHAMEARVASQSEHCHPEEPSRWTEIHAFPCQIGLGINYRDITCRKNAEEARKVAIVDSCNDAIISKDLNCKIRSWNKAAERIFGYTAAEAIGQPVSMLVLPGEEDEIPRILDRLKRGESVNHFQTKRRTKAGDIVTVSITVSPIIDESGQLVGASKVARDMTQQKLGEELQLRLAAIIESSDDAIISKDLEGRILSWNGGAERMFGYSAQEVIGNSVSMLAAPGAEDDLPKIIDRLRRGERVGHYRAKRCTKDGRILTTSLAVSPLRDASGRVVGASNVLRDITETERSGKALLVSNEALGRANSDLEQFSFTAAHDLQEPLRMVTTYSQLLQRKYTGRLDEEADEFITFCVEGATKAATLVRDLMIYINATSMGIEPRPLTDLNRLVARAVADLQVAGTGPKPTVIYNALPEVRAHEKLMQQLLENLISNAVKYRGEAAPVVSIAVVRREREWLISVRDNGIGIAPEYTDRIFGLFKRLHTARQYSGNGLGLAVCKRIAECHGGKIWVESELGAGSTFYFTLPD